MPGGGWYDSRYPRDVDVVNALITSSNPFTTDGEIYEMNVSNITSGAITLLVQDRQSTPQAIIPTITVPGNTVDLILYQGTGLLCKGGLNWQPGSSGLVGSIRGRRTTGWQLDANSPYCNSTGT